MELAIPMAVVAVVLLIPSIFLLVRMLKTTGELRQLDTNLAAKTKELEHANTQLQSAGEDSAAAQELRIEVAGLQQQLNDKTELLARADASVKDLETKRDELQTQVANLGRSETQLTEELKNERSTLGGAKESLGSAEKERDQYRVELEQTRIRESKVNAELANTQELLVEREELLKQAKESFKVLSTQTLEQQQKAFMESADANLKEREAAVKKLVDPLSQKVDALEKARERSQGMMQQQIESLIESNSELSGQTQNLSSALTYKPQVRGQWGEMQVERVLQLAELKKGIHYDTQVTDDLGQRPDFVVHLPNRRDIILDSKVSLKAYMDAQLADDEKTKEDCLRSHASSMRGHFQALAKKKYPSGNKSAADYVVMVVPDYALHPATERDPALMDDAAESDVVICSYSNLHPLIKCVAMSWQEREIAQNAMEIRDLGKDLHDRLAVFAGHLDGVGKGLDDAIKRYNKGVRSFDSRVTPQARRFLGHGITSTNRIADGRTVDTNAEYIKSIDAVVPDKPPTEGDNGGHKALDAIAFEGSDADGFRLKPSEPC